jgi:hypothetical protein
LRTLISLLLIIAWAAIAFAIIRSVVLAWGLHRRYALAVALAVAVAFALGALSPIALPSWPSLTAGSAAAPPLVDSTRTVACPPNAVLGATTARGSVDNAVLGQAAPVPPSGAIDIPAGTPIRFAGWIVLAAGPSAAICPVVDGHAVAATMQYGLPRPDVATALGQSADVPSGFLVTLRLKPGTHAVRIGAVETDGHTIETMQREPITVRVH